jgi:hypothetical protein
MRVLGRLLLGTFLSTLPLVVAAAEPDSSNPPQISQVGARPDPAEAEHKIAEEKRAAAKELREIEEEKRAIAKEKREIEEYDIRRQENRFALGGIFSTAATLVGIVAFVFGLYQYRRAEEWKRTEFLAKETEAFFGDPVVRNALLMIDWAPRHINLYLSTSTDPLDYPLVTRVDQIAALLPHTSLKKQVPEGSEGALESASETSTEPANSDLFPEAERLKYAARGLVPKWSFTLNEAQIRDTYDAFLDRLDRLAAYAKGNLIAGSGLDTHLGYWLKDISAPTRDPLDAAWTCSLLHYIHTYGYSNVQGLFCERNTSIDVEGTLYRQLLSQPGVRDLLEEAKYVVKRAGAGGQGERGE